MENDIIRFPGFGLELHVGKSLDIFGFNLAFYGLLIGIGALLGAKLAYSEAKRTGQNVDDYVDFTFWMLIFAILGARIYYVVFEWDYYKNNLLEIINIRNGGLAVYGGVIAAVIVLFIFAKVKHLNPLQMLDTACLGLVVGQIVGRFGNFCNREAFGGYYTGKFAMEIPITEANGLTGELVAKSVNGYISVHPTFLYESAWNLVGLILLLIYTRKIKKVHGEVFAGYMLWYGIGRFFIEGLRTDQLIIGNTGIAVSQVVSVVIAILGATFIIYSRIKIKRKTNKNIA